MVRPRSRAAIAAIRAGHNQYRPGRDPRAPPCDRPPPVAVLGHRARSRSRGAGDGRRHRRPRRRPARPGEPATRWWRSNRSTTRTVPPSPWRGRAARSTLALPDWSVDVDERHPRSATAPVSCSSTRPTTPPGRCSAATPRPSPACVEPRRPRRHRRGLRAPCSTVSTSRCRRSRAWPIERSRSPRPARRSRSPAGRSDGPRPGTKLVDADADATKQFLTYVSSGPFQHAVTVGLIFDDEYYRQLAAGLAAKRDLLSDGLEKAGFEVHRPAGTYFVMADARPLGFDDGEALCRSLPERRGVVAVPAAVLSTCTPTGSAPAALRAQRTRCCNRRSAGEAVRAAQRPSRRRERQLAVCAGPG